MTETEEDAQVTVTKYMAFRRAQRRNRTKAHLISWMLALPVAWLAWKSKSYQLLLDWLNLTTVVGERLRLLTEIATVGWVWMLTVTFLFPLRWHLRSRWRVDPERFGLSDNEEREQE